MKVSYEEELAIHFGLQRRCGEGNDPVLSVRPGGKRRPAIELRNQKFCGPTRSLHGEGNNGATDNGEGATNAVESENLSMCGNSKRENREIRMAPNDGMSPSRGRSGNRTAGKPE